MSLTVQQERQRIQELISLDNRSDQDNSQYYSDCLAYIQNHLTTFYQQYADENGLSITQTVSRVSKWDLAEWKRALDSLGDTSEWPDEAIKRVKLQSFTAGIDKGHLLGAIFALSIIALTVKQQRAIAKRIMSDGKTEAKRMIQTFNLPSKQRRRVTSIITQPETRKIWSNNLWIDSDKLAGDVQFLVNQQLKHGMSLSDLSNILASHANPSQFKPNQSLADRIRQMEFNTRRIVRTESARLIDEVNTATYRMKGVKEVDLVTEPGACSKCQGLADEGPYNLDEAPLIPRDTHPNCRCIKIPHVSVMEKRQLAAEKLGLTKDEQAGLLRWVSGDSYKLNSLLYSNQQPTGLLKTTMTELDAGLEKLPKFKGELWRSVDLSGKELTNYLWKFTPGSNYVPSEYLAFTKSSGLYNSVARVQIVIKHAANGRNLGAFNLSEGEVLYERGTSFKVADTYVDDANRFIIELEDH